MRQLLTLPLLLLCGFAAHAAECPADTDAPCNISEARVLSSGIAYRLELRETRLDAAVHGNRYPSGYWGADGKYPDTHIAALSLILDNAEIGIPAKLYSDLGNLEVARVRENQNAVVLELRGGKDHAAFYATYVFIDGVLRKRTVRSSLEPDKVWEKTTFNAPSP